LLRPTPRESRKRGRKRRFPRLARKALPACEVRNLLRHSPVFQKQPWQRFHIKDGEKGPMVWEVKHTSFYRKHGEDGLPGPAHTLIGARNVLDPQEVKYFVSNMVPGRNGVTLRWLLWVAFSRWPIERCFEFDKGQVGMDHFEVRLWSAIHRHFYVTQVSQLFCARVHQRLREKNDFEFVPDRRAGSGCRIRLDRGASAAAGRPPDRVPESGRTDRLLPASQSPGETIPYEQDRPPAPEPRHRSRPVEILRT